MTLLSFNGVAVLLAIIVICCVIGGVAFVIYRKMNPKLKSDVEKPNENDLVQEELDRVLQPVDDEETARQISEYKDEE